MTVDGDDGGDDDGDDDGVDDDGGDDDGGVDHEGEKQRYQKPFETICNFASCSRLVVALKGKRKQDKK